MLASPSRRLSVATLLTLWMATLILTRMALTGSIFGSFLVWNLFLAAVPLMASTALVALDQKGGSLSARLALAAVWLLFLPNAPYILTDLVHLAERPPVPFWFDLALLLSAAGTGLLSGYVALADVQGVVARHWGHRVAWATSVGVLFLSAFGIYLGRELRWNSWDVLTAPGTLATDILTRIADPFAHPTTVVMTLVFGGMLTLGYVVLHALAMPVQEEPDHA
ncbi:MAG: DUF1361 domain-containing protein [Rubricoccaceae bacterium]